ncbi:RNA-binding protein [Sorangium sp. So ce295]|jgi:RNA recognition motif-containing protein|uniref:RNA recognition motif domain-containing protein n=1 Tax=Sorangium sp. So ce295 TaxID=3133295 RepID=UPI003F5DEFE3
MGNRLYVGNLSFSTTRETLESAFAAAGEVREIAMPTDRETGQPRGFAFVTMGSAQAANSAISQLNGAVLDGRALKVNEAQERPARGFGGGGGGGFGGGGGGGGFGGGGGGFGGGGYGGGGGGGGRGGRGGSGGRGGRGDRY